MSSAVSALYERLIERDLEAIPSVVKAFHSSEELFLAVARFAVLAYVPSEHAKHAFLSTLAAYEMREQYGERWNDLLIECARYAAESRQPWSEPPILEPPVVDNDQPRDVDALRAAVAAHDRLAAERWLAARLDDQSLLDDLLTVAADDFEDLGHKVIITRAAWKLALILGEKGRYATLRVALWEMTSNAGPTLSGPGPAESRPSMREQLIDNAVAEKGSIESVHAVFLYEAANDTSVFDRVCDHLAAQPLRSASDELPPAGPPPVYRLARDYAQCLIAYAVGDARLKAAAAYNLEHGPSFADWSLE
ncbi:MAG TPA: hypothetical protein VLV78_17825 [Thermoanaerobaculia bacterium]|nr:hypothetical protein [Thermoanaerobaculia bacterium]